MAKLTFVLEDGQDVVVPVAERVSLGRDDGNDIVVDDQRISARHAELVRGESGRFEVCDLDSKAGTFVNGDRVQKRRPITDGDKIAFGPLIAVFDTEEAAVPAPNGAATTEKSPAKEKEKDRDKEKPLAPKADKPVAPKKVERVEKEIKKVARPEVVPKSIKRKDDTVAVAGPAKTPATAAPVAAAKADETPPELFARLEAGQKSGIEKLEKDKLRLQGEVDALQRALRDWQDRAAKAQDTAHGEQRKLDDTRKDLALTLAEIKSATTQEEHLQAQLREAANELSTKGARVEKLRAEEERLRHVTESLHDAESSHAQWIDAINALASQHDQKNSEILRITAAAERAQRELESVSSHKDEAQAVLKQVREEQESNENHLAGLRQQVTALEARSQDVKMLSDARSDQVKTAEKKLEQMERQRSQLEAQIKQMSGVEERLSKAHAQCLEKESTHEMLSASLASLGVGKQRAEDELNKLNEQIAALQGERGQIGAATQEARLAQQQVEEALQRIHGERETHEKDLAAKREQLIAEMMR
ncbi:MAG TPA: FHA domain-containing protein, partial [Verrucomicrobiaceae bacterium]